MNAPRRAVAALAAYSLAAVVSTWPLVLRPASVLASTEGPGDSYLNLWILGWDLHTLSTRPGALLDGTIFNANIFHPATGTLAYSDHLILQAIALWPLFRATGDVVLCYNILFALSLVASAVAMHAFARAVTGSEAGALVAGLAWGFGPFHFAHLNHLQLQGMYFFPLSFLCLHRLMAGRRWRDAIGLGVMSALQAIGSVYYGVIGAIALVSGAAALMAGIGRWRSGAIMRRLALAGAVGMVLVAPVVARYWRVQQREGFGRNLFEAAHAAARVGSYVQPPAVNLVYGRTGLLPTYTTQTNRRTSGVEQQLFSGFALIALASVGVWVGSRGDSRPLVLSMLVVIAIGFVLSLGPDGVRLLYAALHRSVFGFQAIRAPARFAVIVMFGLASLAALGVRETTARFRSHRRLVAAAIVGLVALEYLNVPIAYVPAPARTSAVGRWLKAAPEPGAVLYLPLSLDLENTPFMLDSLEHGRPLVNGYSGQRPAFYTALVDAMSTFPEGDSLSVLHDLNVRFIVSPRTIPVTGASPLVERQRVLGGVIYELRWTPELASLLSPASDEAPPPAPAVLPFGPGEVATYNLTWKSAFGALGLAAGQATLSVVSAEQAPARLVLRARGQTAEWVSRFFEADDLFESRVDANLLPLTYEQRLREGRRRVDRRMRFDHAARVVRVGDPSGRGDRGVALPIAAGTRDPVSAFYYARSLPLAPGARIRLPVNDVGRSLTLELGGVSFETITYDQAQAPALRIEPRLEYRVEHRAPIHVVVWLSRDARRVPLAFEVNAGFGAVRGELAAYRPH